MNDTPQAAKGTTSIAKTSPGFSEEERAAIKERARELKAEARRGARAQKVEADGERNVLAKIAAMPEPDRAMAERLHSVIRASAPDLSPRLWYGMPAYGRDAKIVCFFQGGYMFKARYGTLAFSDKAKLDDGPMWPTYFALTEWTAAVEARISALVTKAVS